MLRVPKYDFNWQLSYKLAEPKFMPKGSTLKVTMHYDNSTGNRFNPDPTATVRWGDQTWEEMMLGYYGTIELPGSDRRPEADADAGYRNADASTSGRKRPHTGITD